MSFDLAVWNMKGEVDKKTAYSIYEMLAENGETEVIVEKGVSHFVIELGSKYPDLHTFDDDNIDDCVWNSDFGGSESYVIMNISWSRSEEVYLFVKELAKKHRLVLYDPQEDVVHDFREVRNDANTQKKKWWAVWKK